MKKLTPLFLSIFWTFISCQDVITVDPPTEAPRLSIDALIRIDESLTVTTAVINVSLSNSFFGQTEPTDVDLISIRNIDYPSDDLNQNILILEKSNQGEYSGAKETEFFTNGSLELYIEHNNERYYAQTIYVPTVPIETLEEGNQTLFTGEETEIVLSITDTPNRTDFYLFDFSFNEYLVSEDTFYKGQNFEFSYFYEDGLRSGYSLEVSVMGVDEQFYNYMNQIIVQAGGDQGPFQTPAATVRGNIINITNGLDTVSEDQESNYPLGYFSVSQEFKKTITLE
ncbi:hypothetical protein [Aurantibacter sp.]|uniref:DUF4249 family protein n=1 Tax=Aurantibacter sp. TaxID=2807103 RepID=UPI003265F646